MFDAVEAEVKAFIQKYHDSLVTANHDFELYDRLYFDSVFATWFYLRKALYQRNKRQNKAALDKQGRASAALCNNREGRYKAFLNNESKFVETEKKEMVSNAHSTLSFSLCFVFRYSLTLNVYVYMCVCI